MKNLKKVLALVLAVVMIMGVVSVASAKTYKDADAEAFKNYADAIDALSSLKILDGFEDETFKADGTLTRAQAAKIVAIVHNAATNGRIQSDIADLYSNAQNPFVDCNTSWALPYINYCRITGLADGMTATTYAPKREVTGVQFLKLMLTTLNFDTAKEGYTGTGWDINVLNRANEIGLTAGLKDGWKAIAPITRGEAAQVLYNALTAYVVEYGQLIKGYTNKTSLPVYNTAFVSNEQVNKAGQMLGEKMGISITRDTDDFRRPGYTWSYGSWVAFYMDAPIGEYKTTVSACEILKNNMKIAETSPKTVTLSGGARDNAVKWDAVNNKWVPDNNQEKLSYIAVDGYKWASTTLGHDNNKACQNTSGSFDSNKFGGQGDLTQVFKTEDGYIITVIHTFLASIDVVSTSKYDHTKTAFSKVSAWIRIDGLDSPADHYKTEVQLAAKNFATTDFAKGSKVLVNITKKAQAINPKAVWYAEDATTYGAGVVSEIAAAESKNGKLTGASDLAYAESVSIDGTKYPTACRFVLGKDDAMNIKNNGTPYTFYFDAYGNVIGREELQTTSEYVVMDKVWAYHTEDGDYVVKANLYDLSGKALEKVTVSNKAGSFKGAMKGTDTKPFYTTKQLDDIADNNDTNLTDALYTYTVDDKGVYTLTWVGYNFDLTGDMKGFGRLDASYQYGTNFTHDAKTAYISAVTAGNEISKIVNISESTKFICKGADGTWKTFTGYTELPALSAQFVDYTYEAGNTTFAAVVYLGEVSYAGDSITGFVASWARFNWAGDYDLITVYVDGEPVVVNVKHAPDATREIGIYTFETKVDEYGVTYSEVYSAKDAEKVTNATVTAVLVSNDGTAVTLNTDAGAVGLTNPAIYRVMTNGTVVKAEAKDIEAGDKIVLYKAAAGQPYTALYIIDQK